VFSLTKLKLLMLGMVLTHSINLNKLAFLVLEI
jgi:hypothetical protein